MAKILVVDDSKLIRFQMKKILEELGHEVVYLAQDGQEGYEKYKELQPDLVTLDINMPILDGMSTVRKIITEFPDAIIIMVSSEGIGNRNIVYDCIGLGATDFIDKPFEIEQVKKTIDANLKL